MTMKVRVYNDLPLSIRIPIYIFVGITLFLLMFPLLAALPIAFNADPWFIYPFRALSMRWFADLFSSPIWRGSMINSLLFAVATTVAATSLGTLAAIGLVNPRLPFRGVAMALAISPIVVPSVVLALGLFIFFTPLSLNYTDLGVVVAHTILATPFVVITATATLTRFDFNLMRAAASLGANRFVAFRTVMLPIIAPGVAAGAVLAFASSFDEVVMVLFIGGPDQRTLPRQMFLGMREHLDPTILAAAVVTILLSTILLALAYRFNKRK